MLSALTNIVLLQEVILTTSFQCWPSYFHRDLASLYKRWPMFLIVEVDWVNQILTWGVQLNSLTDISFIDASISQPAHQIIHSFIVNKKQMERWYSFLVATISISHHKSLMQVTSSSEWWKNSLFFLTAWLNCGGVSWLLTSKFLHCFMHLGLAWSWKKECKKWNNDDNPTHYVPL